MLVSANVGSIKEEIAFRLNELESDNTTNYLNWINLCLQDLQFSFPNAPFLRTSADFTLTAQTRIYTTSAAFTNYFRMNTLTDPVGGVRIQFLPPEQFDIAVPSATQFGTPRLYTIRGYGISSRFELYPVPAAADVIHGDFQAQIGYVSAESAIPNIPPQYAELPVLYGEFRGLRRRGRYNESAQVQKDYEALKERMREDLLSYTAELPRIKGVREFTPVNPSYYDPIWNGFFNNQY